MVSNTSLHKVAHYLSLARQTPLLFLLLILHPITWIDIPTGSHRRLSVRPFIPPSRPLVLQIHCYVIRIAIECNRFNWKAQSIFPCRNKTQNDCLSDAYRNWGSFLRKNRYRNVAKNAECKTNGRTTNVSFAGHH